ncbi:MAG: DNA integrity scanning diadenylate cyclase DisA [Coriobacteriia bacterium]|nr:DNA integrity scanning diadenylate cyclase DisA [Coriobacteriia bacterium]
MDRVTEPRARKQGGKQDMVLAGLRRVAPGTRLREALDMLLDAQDGALIVVGDAKVVEPVCDGGFTIDMPFTPQRLFELAKMDGAIILDAEGDRIVKAGVHLVPDSGLPTSEVGMRHRTSERVSRQIDALTIAISKRRNVINLYLDGNKVTLEAIEVLLAKANQAIQTLQNYRNRLDEMLERLTLLEFQDLVTLADVAEIVVRFEMARRVQRAVSRYILQLGTEGLLVRMQSDELIAGVDEQYALVLRDYAASSLARKVTQVRDRLSELSADRLLEPESIARELGLMPGDHAERHLRARGYRALAQIPMLPGSVVARIIDRFGTLVEVAAATTKELDAIDGVGVRRARAIHAGLARLKAHTAV